MKNIFLTDVLDQPNAMRRALDYYKNYGDLFEQIAALKPSEVIFCGMGSSHYCSQSAMIRLNEAGIPARVESAGEILYYEWNTLRENALIVLVSQSGESGEIVDIISKLPSDRSVIGITNNPESTLGRRVDICLLMHVDEELAVSTRTYLASLILADLTASALLGQTLDEVIDRSNHAVSVLERFLIDHEEIQQKISGFFSHPDFVCYIGRGHAVSTAECGALFTRETAKYPALAFDSAEFRHGPFEMVDNTFCAILFAPGGKTDHLQRNLANAIAEHNGKVLFVTDTDTSFDSENVLVVKHPSVSEQSAPLVQIAAAQLFANDMALHLGHAPGVFRQSSKITTAQ